MLCAVVSAVVANFANDMLDVKRSKKEELDTYFKGYSDGYKERDTITYVSPARVDSILFTK